MVCPGPARVLAGACSLSACFRVVQCVRVCCVVWSSSALPQTRRVATAACLGWPGTSDRSGCRLTTAWHKIDVPMPRQRVHGDCRTSAKVSCGGPVTASGSYRLRGRGRPAAAPAAGPVCSLCGTWPDARSCRSTRRCGHQMGDRRIDEAPVVAREGWFANRPAFCAGYRSRAGWPWTEGQRLCWLFCVVGVVVLRTRSRWTRLGV